MLKALLRAGVVNALWWCNRRSDQSRKRTWNGERSTPRGSMFGSGHGISGPVHVDYYVLFPITSIRVVRHCPM